MKNSSSIILATTKATYAIPFGILLFCIVSLQASLLQVAQGKYGYNDPEMSPSSYVSWFLLTFAPYWWAGLIGGLLIIISAVQGEHFFCNFWSSLFATMISIVLWIGRELLDWQLVPICEESHVSFKRIVGSVVLVALVAARVLSQRKSNYESVIKQPSTNKCP